MINSSTSRILFLTTLLVNGVNVSGYLGTPPHDPKLTEATKNALKRPLTISDYTEAVKAGMHTLLSPEPVPEMITQADEDSPFWMKIREDEWLKDYHAKLKEVKSRPTNQYSRIPEGMFWKLPSGVPIEGGYIPVPKDMRHAEWKKKWGVQTAPEEEYWFHPAIHTFGNVGFLGGVHSVAAPLATKIIDTLAYNGRSVREEIGVMLRDKIGEESKKVIDMGCGVGISTRALAKAFASPSNTVIGLDTSPQMLQMANVQTRYHKAKDTFDSALHKQEGSQATPKFIRSNAESTKFEDKTFDLVTIMYLCHEAPKLGRYKIFREARRLLKPGGTLAVVDISPVYSPSATMLAGEPYVLEYQENIHEQIEKIQGFGEREYRVVVPGHVGMWLNTRL